MLSLSTGLSFALEDFTPAQKTCAGLICNEFEKCVELKVYTKEAKEKITELAKRLIGVQIKFETIPDTNAAVYNAIVLNNGGVRYDTCYSQNNQTANEMADFIISNCGDYAPSKVYGYDNKTGQFYGAGIKDLVFPLYMGEGLLKSMTPKEVTAFFLHEIGHIWVTLKTIGSWFDQSQVALAASVFSSGETLKDKQSIELVKMVLNRLDSNKHSKLYNKLKSGNYTKKDFVKACVLINDDREVIEGTSTSDGITRRNEQGADYFSSTLGFGKHLASGLMKANVLPYTNATVGLRTAFSLLVIGGTIAGTMLMSPLALAGWAIIGLESSLDVFDTYDNNTDRIKRIRRNAIGAIKKAGKEGFSKEEGEELLACVDSLEKALQNSRHFDNLTYFLNPFYIRRYLGRRQEDRLEDLMNSELYVTAHRLLQD